MSPSDGFMRGFPGGGNVMPASDDVQSPGRTVPSWLLESSALGRERTQEEMLHDLALLEEKEEEQRPPREQTPQPESFSVAQFERVKLWLSRRGYFRPKSAENRIPEIAAELEVAAPVVQGCLTRLQDDFVFRNTSNRSFSC